MLSSADQTESAKSSDLFMDVAAKWDIGAMPTFIFIKNEKKVTEVVGADPGKLGKKLQELRT